MISFRHGGKLGDLCYSLPTIKALGGGILYIPETSHESSALYSNIKSLLDLQPYIKEVREYPSMLPYLELARGIHIDYDLDKARLQPGKGVIHIVKRYMDAFGIKDPNWKRPWLVLDDHPSPIPGNYNLINYTGRHVINDRVPHGTFDWKKLVTQCEQPLYFVGSIEEHSEFCKTVGDIPHFPTTDVLSLARVIQHCNSIFFNQSLCTALAQAMGKNYYLYPKPGKRNCILGGVPYEHILQ